MKMMIRQQIELFLPAIFPGFRCGDHRNAVKIYIHIYTYIYISDRYPCSDFRHTVGNCREHGPRSGVELALGECGADHLASRLGLPLSSESLDHDFVLKPMGEDWGSTILRNLILVNDVI